MSASTGTYTVSGKGVTIGRGRPGILVSASGSSPLAVLDSVAKLAAVPEITGIELRLDYLDRGRNSDEIAEMADLVNAAWEAAGKKLLIVTVRTRAEGGEAEFTAPEYARLVGSLVSMAKMDLVDIEVSRGDALARGLCEAAHAAGIGVIASFHDFAETPDPEAMIRILRKEKDLGGDIRKLAVMPRCAHDVAALLWTTARASEEGLSPLVTMSMGAAGSVTRVAGEVFGSALTFAMVGEASAPGQLTVSQVEEITRALSPLRA